MAQYIVQGDQNLWDVALYLYGSVEGMFDLLISNPKLTFNTPLHHGDTLEYHDEFVINQSIVNTFKKEDLLPANKERHVYFKETNAPLRMYSVVKPETTSIAFKAGGSGVMIVDWGDNSELESIVLTPTAKTYQHYFDNNVDSRKLKFYGDFSFTKLDLTGYIGSMYPITPITVDEFVSQFNFGDLTGLFLYEGMVKLDLSGSKILTLAPIYNYGKDARNGVYNGLQYLDLTSVQFKDIEVLDDYLEYLAGSITHGLRRPCEIHIDTYPTQRGYEAIDKILKEPQWNEDRFGTSWKFFICGELYQPLETEENESEE